MSLSIIVAMTPDRVIGVNNQLPWSIPDDLKRFKRLTMGHPIIMGRRTFESIGRALPGRQNIVVSSDNSLAGKGVLVVGSLDEALDRCDQSTSEEFVIGGARLFESALKNARRLYLTTVHAKLSGDVFFPEFDSSLFDWSAPELSEPLDPIQSSFSIGTRK